MATRLPDVFRTASPDQGHGQASSAFRTLDRLLLEQSRHGDPFSVLGLHEDPDGSLRIRACLPGARRVCAVWTLARRRPSQDAQAGDAPKEQRLSLARLRSDWLEAETGRVEWSPLFEAEVPRRRTRFRYHLEVEWDSGLRERLDDPYQWGTWLPSLGLQAFARGLHWRPHRLLGAHPVSWAGVAGVSFAVWAPEAQAVSVVGDFNAWDGRRHPMRRHGPRVAAAPLDRVLPHPVDVEQEVLAHLRRHVEHTAVGRDNDNRREVGLKGPIHVGEALNVKHVHLIDKQHCAGSKHSEGILCCRDDFADIFDTCCDRRKFHEFGRTCPRHQLRQRCLSGAGWTPQDK